VFGMSRLPRLDKVPPRPERVQPDVDGDRLLEVVMHEYDAIRSEIDHSSTNQVSILSFGAAAVGLLVAAAGTLWTDEPLLAGLLLLFVVPAVGFLALAIHAGEFVRLTRAGLFLYELEECVNSGARPQGSRLACSRGSTGESARGPGRGPP
jgi:hypothetical protein